MMQHVITSQGGSFTLTEDTTRRRDSLDKGLDLLWRRACFNNLFLWRGTRNTKTNRASPHFKYKINKEPSWIHAFPNPCWVQE
eukprot:c11081_g2_i1 orf=44-292(+)